ncbi:MULTISPECIES: nuclear transport factor 2 family protein [Sphingobacterium]|uniref:Nuclear transport factor 2 family protein n=1 Tax=Sphingobacterium tenebrionis TaxID=3111775 RepID=A0ABU8I980_9SPHI|nr:nuclear transport factor 2 family protein [Sphingobacterium sp. 1.A.4]
MNLREEIVRNYIQAYNNFDVEGMVQHFSEDVVFENIQNGVTTDSLEGIEAFKEQAESAKSFFEDREQVISELHESSNLIEVRILYTASLAMDISDTMKQGDKIELAGKSYFYFNDQNQVVKLQDLS